jgi:hypothetical protein
MLTAFCIIEALNLKMLLYTFTQWKVRHVGREAKFAARGLAKLQAIHWGLDKTWLEEINP